jgi:hypothetical protein
MLPASPTARRKELAHRERARLERIDAQLDTLAAMSREVAKAPPTPTPAVVDPRVTALASAMSDPLYHFPRGAQVSLTFDDNDEVIATGLTIAGRFWSIESIIACGLINERGAWLWHRWHAIHMALPPVEAGPVREHYQATVAGRVYERGAAIG